ncbi:MAG: cobalt-precorrin 5A hydrolase [Firmicutes bacterium]|nr:cobalt-precorrin 5A hydrolase [Bacillota bacterium]
MKIAIVTLTRRGTSVGCRLRERLAVLGDEVDVYVPMKIVQRYASVTGDRQVNLYSSNLTQLLGEIYHQYQALICVMATGLVVRVIAPLLQHKTTDPPVIVVDEGARFAISLVAGHWGGGNRLTERVAAELGAVPVVTTASEVRGKIAVDVLAREWGATLEPLDWLPAVNAALVNGEELPIFTDLALPDQPANWATGGYRVFPLAQYQPESADEVVLLTSQNVPLPRGAYLFVRPRTLVAGIGCRRGVSRAEILEAVTAALKLANRSRQSLRKLATIALKADEAGILEAAAALGVPIEFYQPDDLARAWEEDSGLSRSPMVKDKIGVDGVCEPACLLGTGNPRLILPKTRFPRVTVALAEVRSGWWESDQGISTS